MNKYTLIYNKTCFSKLYQLFNPQETNTSDFGYTFTNDNTILDKTLEGYRSNPPSPSDDLKAKIFDLIDDTVNAIFPVGETIRMLGTEEAWPHLKMDTSAGVHYPGMTKREALHYTTDEDKSEPNKRARNMFNWIKEHPRTVCDKYPCVLAVKPKCYKYGDPTLQPRASDVSQHIDTVKGRLIWVQPIEMSLFELCFYHPFYEYNRRNQSSAMAMGVNTRARILRCSQDLRYSSVSVDWSAFDQTVPSWILHRIIDRLVHRLSIPHEFRLHTEEDVYKKEIIKILTSHFIHTQLILPDGSRFTAKHHGIPSGSQGTQLVGTIANMVVIRYLISEFHIPAHSLMCLGDDSYFEIEDETVPPFTLMAVRAQELFGMNMHPDKCIFNPPHTAMDFLGYRGSNGFLVVDQDKYEFKLRFLSRPMPLEHEIGRFISLYLMGGYALQSYQEIATKLRTQPSREFAELIIPQDESNKLMYVFGLDPTKITHSLAMDILWTDPFLLSIGELTYGSAYKHKSPFTLRQLIGKVDYINTLLSTFN